MAMSTQQDALPPLSIRAWLRFDRISRVLAERSPKTVLEVGCGQGALGARLASLVDNYLGVEPDAKSFAVAKERIERFGGTVLNVEDDSLGEDQLFDLVCAFEVLEHIEDDVAALNRWSSHVRPGGSLLLSVPAWQQRFGPMDANVGHFRRYDPDILKGRLEDSGLTDVQLWLYGWPLGFALEAVRNRIDARRLAKAQAQGATVAELSAASGRTFQPPNPYVGRAVEVATVPFRSLQRTRPTSGIGLVATARKPS